jgi:hypothetical protein
MENANFSCSPGASLALSEDDAEMLLFAFDADLDTQLDVVPFGSTERLVTFESPASNKSVD